MSAIVEHCAEYRALISENRALKDNFDSELARSTAHLRTELREVRRKLFCPISRNDIIACSRAMQEVLAFAEMLRDNPDIPALIEGETGTGKELIARLIHGGGDEADRPFIDMNCSAINAELFEAELFGYAAGAFTGARKDGAPGKIQLAGKGTLFLDEIGDMPLALQPKLLRVLQERTYYQVSGAKKQMCEARIIAATNRDLSAMMASGAFRRDLFHRLEAGHIRLAPLRQRPEDIIPLAEKFLSQAAAKRHKRFRGFAEEAKALLMAYSWPGNVRELENMIERIVLLHDGEEVLPEHLADILPKPINSSKNITASQSLLITEDGIHLPEKGFDLRQLNIRIAQAAVAKFHGHKGKAAVYLGLTRNSLERRLRNRD